MYSPNRERSTSIACAFNEGAESFEGFTAPEVIPCRFLYPLIAPRRIALPLTPRYADRERSE